MVVVSIYSHIGDTLFIIVHLCTFSLTMDVFNFVVSFFSSSVSSRPALINAKHTKNWLSEMVFFVIFSNSLSIHWETPSMVEKRSNSGHLLDASKCALNCDFLSHSSHGCSVFFSMFYFFGPVNVSFLFYLSTLSLFLYSGWRLVFSVVFTNWLHTKTGAQVVSVIFHHIYLSSDFLCFVSDNNGD